MQGIYWRREVINVEWVKEIHESLKIKDELRTLYIQVVNETIEELRRELGHDRVKLPAGIDGKGYTLRVGSLTVSFDLSFDEALDKAMQAVASFELVNRNHFQNYIRATIEHAIGEK